MLTNLRETGQGLSHVELRRELTHYGKDENDPEWDENKSILLFRFVTNDDGADGIAARVTTTRDVGDADEPVSDFPITQAKRSATRKSALTGPGLTAEELKARVKAGRAYQTRIHENLTVRYSSYVFASTVSKRYCRN